MMRQAKSGYRRSARPGRQQAASPRQAGGGSALAQLQARADNSPHSRSMTTLQAAADRKASALPQPQPSNPLQRKRNVDDTARSDFARDPFLVGKVESVEQADDYYGQSLKKARELRGHVKPWFTGTATAAPAPPSDTTVKERVAGATYKHFWTVGENEVTVYVGRSRNLDDEVSRAVGSEDDVPDSLYIYYENAYDVTEGRLKGINNDREEDKSDNPDRPAALPNSTILWFTKVIALEKYRAAHPDAQMKNQVSFVSRQTVINPQSMGTMFMADTGRVAYPGDGDGGRVTLEEPTQDAWAILGTPNARSTFFMLKDHEEGGGAVDIKQVSFDSNDINIEFTRD